MLLSLKLTPMGSCRIAAKFMALDKLYGQGAPAKRRRAGSSCGPRRNERTYEHAGDALLCRFAQSSGFEQSMEAMFHVPFSSPPVACRCLRLHPFFFGIIDIEEIVDVVLKVLGHKLRNVIFHVFLDTIIHLGQAFVPEIVVPLNDFDSFSRFGVFLNPSCNLFVVRAGCDEILELVCSNAREFKKHTVDRTIKVVFAQSRRLAVSAFPV
jgi:hypothetical protein